MPKRRARPGPSARCSSFARGKVRSAKKDGFLRGYPEKKTLMNKRGRNLAKFNIIAFFHFCSCMLYIQMYDCYVPICVLIHFSNNIFFRSADPHHVFFDLAFWPPFAQKLPSSACAEAGESIRSLSLPGGADGLTGDLRTPRDELCAADSSSVFQ